MNAGLSEAVITVGLLKKRKRKGRETKQMEIEAKDLRGDRMCLYFLVVGLC